MSAIHTANSAKKCKLYGSCSHRKKNHFMFYCKPNLHKSRVGKESVHKVLAISYDASHIVKHHRTSGN